MKRSARFLLGGLLGLFLGYALVLLLLPQPWAQRQRFRRQRRRAEETLLGPDSDR